MALEVTLELTFRLSHITRLVLPFSRRPEDAAGGARPVPRPVWDGAPRRHEWRAYQPRRRLRQPAQHVPADERGRCRRRCGGLRALPDGRCCRRARAGTPAHACEQSPSVPEPARCHQHAAALS